jgi:protein-disulfide isomerase
MKKILLPLFALISLVGCAKPAPQSPEALQKKVDSLATELADVKNVLGYMIGKGDADTYEQYKEQVRQEIERASKVWDLKLDESPSIGDPKAKVTIVVFSEFQCPFCARIAPVIDSLVMANPDKVRLVFKHFPLNFHKDAPAAAAASIAAQKQGKFWEYYNALSPNYQSLNDSTFIAIAEKVGLNVEQFKKDMVLDAEKQAIIDRDMKLGMEVGVQGTPNFYVNGKRQDRFGPDLIDKMIKELYK